MHWMFWKKKSEAAGNAGMPPGMSRPKDLPQPVGRHLVVDKGLDPDWVWNLKVVTCRRAEQPDIRDFRVFSPVQARELAVNVKHYRVLDDHPELILFDGWLNTKTNKLELNQRNLERAA